MFLSTRAIRSIRQCSARVLIRSSTVCMSVKVPVARRSVNSRPLARLFISFRIAGRCLPVISAYASSQLTMCSRMWMRSSTAAAFRSSPNNFRIPPKSSVMFPLRSYRRGASESSIIRLSSMNLSTWFAYSALIESRSEEMSLMSRGRLMRPARATILTAVFFTSERLTSIVSKSATTCFAVRLAPECSSSNPNSLQ